MNRAEKLKAGVKRVGGVKIPCRPTKKPTVVESEELKMLKKSMVNTMLTTCSYKEKDTIYNYENPQIKAILENRKKPIAIYVSGKVTETKESDALKEMPEGWEEKLSAFRTKSEEETSKETENIEGTINKKKSE